MIRSNPIFCRAGGIQDFPIWVQLIPQVEHITTKGLLTYCFLLKNKSSF